MVLNALVWHLWLVHRQVNVAVRQPYSCEVTSMQAVVPVGETTVDVEIIPGTSVNLSPGYHTVAIPSVNCFINVTVNAASEFLKYFYAITCSAIALNMQTQGPHISILHT